MQSHCKLTHLQLHTSRPFSCMEEIGHVCRAAACMPVRSCLHLCFTIVWGLFAALDMLSSVVYVTWLSLSQWVQTVVSFWRMCYADLMHNRYLILFTMLLAGSVIWFDKWYQSNGWLSQWSCVCAWKKQKVCYFTSEIFLVHCVPRFGRYLCYSLCWFLWNGSDYFPNLSVLAFVHM